LFPGENYLTQIKQIIECLGSQDEGELAFIKNDQAKDYVRRIYNLPKVKMIIKII